MSDMGKSISLNGEIGEYCRDVARLTLSMFCM